MTDARFAQYRSFVEQTPERPDGYLFDEPRARFRPEPGDDLVSLPVLLRPTPSGTRIECPQLSEEVGIDQARVKAAFTALHPGPCSYAHLLTLLGSDQPGFLEHLFGKVVFAPGAVAALEVELPSLEIVRFPGSSYEVVRSYWRNMIAVRRRLAEVGVPGDAADLKRLLLELHQLALVGEPHADARSSFYLPASLLGRKRPEPGTFYDVPSAFERRGSDVVVTSGARVAVPLLGGEHYWQLLAESVSDPDALAHERQVTLDGLSLGQVVRARAENETEARPWFLPARPLLDGHFEALQQELELARAAEAKRDVPATLAALAAFQYRFVRLHPLPSANQSVSMCFVNATLRRLFGIGIPHLLLDQLALRFTLPAYQELFARAARAWSAPWPSPAERARYLFGMRQSLNAFVTDLSQAPSLLQARALLLERPDAARLALLVP